MGYSSTVRLSLRSQDRSIPLRQTSAQWVMPNKHFTVKPNDKWEVVVWVDGVEDVRDVLVFVGRHLAGSKVPVNEYPPRREGFAQLATPAD